MGLSLFQILHTVLILGNPPVTLLGKIYALGGHNGLSIFDSVEMLDTVTGVWAETVPMLSKRCRLGVATLHGELTMVNLSRSVNEMLCRENLCLWRV